MVQLDRNEDLFSLLENLDVPLYVAERPEGSDTFLFSLINQAHRRHSGLKDGDLQGSSIFDVMPTERAERLEARYRSALSRRKPIRTDKTIVVNGLPTLWRTEIHPFPGLKIQDRVLGIGAEVPQAANESSYSAKMREFQFRSVTALLHATMLTRSLRARDAENCPDMSCKVFREAAEICSAITHRLAEVAEQSKSLRMS